MNTLKIIVQRFNKTGWPVIAEYNQTDAYLPQRREHTLTLDETELNTRLNNPLAYGTLLGQALFTDVIRDIWTIAISQTKDALRVMLIIEAPDLRYWHWQYLCAPMGANGRWQHLATNQRTHFSHYLPSLTDRRFPPIGRRDLRALIVLANPPQNNPYDLATFDETATFAGVKKSLGSIPHHLLGSIDQAAAPPSINQICAQITAQNYPILHIVAHGWYNQDKDITYLYLLDDTGQVKPITADQFISRLANLQGKGGLPHLTFLSTCESAAPEADHEGALGGLAHRLVRKLGMPAVVAMTKRVSIHTATHLASQFYTRLRANDGSVPRALVEAGAQLAEEDDITVAALYERLGQRTLFSDSVDKPLNDQDILTGFDTLKKLLPTHAPVLIPHIEQAHQTILHLHNQDTPLTPAQQEEHANQLAMVNDLCQEIFDMTFHALALGLPPPPYNADCPFPGLAPFTFHDAQYFFSRDEIVAQLRRRLNSHPFLALLGPSGAGKTSLLLAGLAPLLVDQDNLNWTHLTPGTTPLNNLNQALSTTPEPRLIIIDQFEEIFTLLDDNDRRQQFIDNLLTLPSPTTKLVISMRADFWGQCAPYENLKLAMQRHQELLSALNTAELRRAMELQAAAVGLRFEADLSHRILAEVADEPGAMPLQQHLLRQMWTRRHGRWLLTSEYHHVGGIKKALAQTANEVIDAILAAQDSDETRHHILNEIKNIFIRLTHLDDRALPGESQHNTRRRVTLSELQNSPHSQKLLDRLVEARLLRTISNDTTNVIQVEVTHEALIRHWDRLLDWLAENQNNLHLRESIRRASQEWRQHHQDDNYLIHRGGRLEDTEYLRQENPSFFNKEEKEYLDACIDQRDRLVRQKEARNLVFVANDLRPKDITKAMRMAQLAYRLDQDNLLPQAANALHQTYYQAIQTKSIFYRQNLPHNSAIGAAAFSPNSQHLLIGDNLGLVNYLTRDGHIHATLNHTAAIRAVTFSPDGTRFVTVGLNNELNLWDQDANPLATLTGHLDDDSNHYKEITDVAFSPDGTRFVTVGSDRQAIIWSHDGQPIKTLRHHADIATRVRFAPNGQFFVTSSKWHNSTAEIYTPAGTHLATLGGDTGYPDGTPHWQKGIYDLAISPDSHHIITVSNNQTVKIWEADGNHLATLTAHTAPVHTVAYARHGRWFVTASFDKTAIIWHPDGQIRATITHDSPLTTLTISPNGQHILTADQTGHIKMSDENGHFQAQLNGHTADITRLLYSPDGTHILSTSIDKTAKIWHTQPPQQTIVRHDGVVTAAIFIPPSTAYTPSTQILTASTDLTVKRWDIATGKPLQTLSGFGPDDFTNRIIHSLEASPDGTRFITTSTDYQVRLWDTITGNLLRSWDSKHSYRHETSGWDGAHRARFSPDSQHIIISDYSGQVKIYSRDGDLIYQLPKHPTEVAAIAISPDNNWIITGCHDSQLRLYPFNSQEIKRTFSHHTTYIASVDFAPDSQTFVAASGDNTLSHWTLDGTLLGTMTGHGHAVTHARFAPDGQSILSAAADTTAKIWHRHGKIAHTITGHNSHVNTANYAPYSHRVITASADKTARIWLLPAAIYYTLQTTYRDIYPLTPPDLEEYGLDPNICFF
ncbi:MAG TPA: CHAT domain-containing protein [Anaerolineae bacterium]|nr:CHAT domain-containing protein [Anaerolineae bacterium]